MSNEIEGLAHLIHPASKLRDVIDGRKTRVVALCGKYAGAKPAPGPVCRDCFNIYALMTAEDAAKAAAG